MQQAPGGAQQAGTAAGRLVGALQGAAGALQGAAAAEIQGSCRWGTRQMGQYQSEIDRKGRLIAAGTHGMDMYASALPACMPPRRRHPPRVESSEGRLKRPSCSPAARSCWKSAAILRSAAAEAAPVRSTSLEKADSGRDSSAEGGAISATSPASITMTKEERGGSGAARGVRVRAGAASVFANLLFCFHR
jgi:hypothetical protein